MAVSLHIVCVCVIRPLRLTQSTQITADAAPETAAVEEAKTEKAAAPALEPAAPATEDAAPAADTVPASDAAAPEAAVPAAEEATPAPETPTAEAPAGAYCLS